MMSMIVDKNSLNEMNLSNRHFHSPLFDLSRFFWQGFQTLVVKYRKDQHHFLYLPAIQFYRFPC